MEMIAYQDSLAVMKHTIVFVSIPNLNDEMKLHRPEGKSESGAGTHLLETYDLWSISMRNMKDEVGELEKKFSGSGDLVCVF